MYNDNEGICPPLRKSDLTPLLSIGQCIELLEGKLLDINHYHKQWQISFIDTPQPATDEVISIGECYSDDLIDALWQAVKEVL